MEQITRQTNLLQRIDEMKIQKKKKNKNANNYALKSYYTTQKTNLTIPLAKTHSTKVVNLKSSPIERIIKQKNS